ncbi:MAG TPA: hypothetical protein VKB50_01410 [Vicinamibacterales bacterium]|nr:hypothetical protein [Vicinamibacterales bacterium]
MTAVGSVQTLEQPPATSRASAISPLQFCVFGVAFVLLATANAAGYRYGASDQAFYIPVVIRALEPAAFPHDAPLIDAQGRLMLGDEVIASVVRMTGLPLDTLFFAAYLFSLVLTWAALAAIGVRIYTSLWGTVALGAAFTLRHRIPRTSANSFEPYFHPRMLAFAICLMGIAALLRRRFVLAVVIVGIGAVIHVTTALWFSILIGTAIAILEPRLRRPAVVIAIVSVALGAWLFTMGPLRARMDGLWLQAVKVKDSLFATDWPVWAWLANLALLGGLWWAHRYRTRHRQASAEDNALVWGATALVAFFLLTLPLVMARVAFPVQLQISRVFWLVDALATIYGLSVVTNRTVMRVIACVIIAVSIARGAFVMLIEQRERALFSVHLSESPWTDAMNWLATEPLTANVLADPGHAWKYGTSVRVAAGRDVFLEEVKDSAIAIYAQDVAARVIERTYALGYFPALTPERAQQLAAKYDLNYLVTEAELALPLAYQNERFHIYRLKEIDR